MIASLALTATLLGNQELKVDRFETSASEATCSTESSTPIANPNATLKLKDASGKVVLEKKIRIAQTSFYDRADGTGGIHPSKETSFLVTYAETDRIGQASEVSLETFDGAFRKTARLPARVRIQ